MPTADARFAYGPFKGEQFRYVAESRDEEHVDWITKILGMSEEKQANYQNAFVQYLVDPDVVHRSNAYVSKLVCTKCGFRETKREDPKYTEMQNYARTRP